MASHPQPVSSRRGAGQGAGSAINDLLQAHPSQHMPPRYTMISHIAKGGEALPKNISSARVSGAMRERT
jgi:hypothetical protein